MTTTTTIQSFTWCRDYAHAWLKVPLQAIQAAGLEIGDFSEFSYIERLPVLRSQICSHRATFGSVFLYLEEDCDAPKFLNHYEKKIGAYQTHLEPEEKHSFVRKLHHIPPVNKEAGEFVQFFDSVPYVANPKIKFLD